MNFMEEELQYDISFSRAVSTFESAYDMTQVHLKELELSHFLQESSSDILYTEAVDELVKKAKSTISEIIKTIIKFICDCRDKLLKHIKNNGALAKIKEGLQQLKDGHAKLDSKKVTIKSDDKMKKDLNEYVREVSKLERRLTNIRLQNRADFGLGKKDAQTIIEFNLIMRELDKLNEKFDKEFLDDNEDTIKMAKEDAIRFTEKQLENVSLDYKELESGGTEILKQMEKDLDGCEHPVKVNILQKMSQSVSTRMRKIAQKKTTYREGNTAIVLGALALVTTATVVVKMDMVKPGTKAKFDSTTASLLTKATGKIDGLTKKMNDLSNELKK